LTGSDCACTVIGGGSPPGQSQSGSFTFPTQLAPEDDGGEVELECIDQCTNKRFTPWHAHTTQVSVEDTGQQGSAVGQAMMTDGQSILQQVSASGQFNGSDSQAGFFVRLLNVGGVNGWEVSIIPATSPQSIRFLITKVGNGISLAGVLRIEGCIE